LSSIFEEICTRVLKKVTPEPGERQRLQDLTWRLIKRTETSAKENNLEVSVRLEGSLAKDTWLSNDVDIDLFMGFSPEVGRKRFEKVALEIARKVADAMNRKRDLRSTRIWKHGLKVRE
jgi:tRNA nucleotidyltransferase (CCA-adding enzyme)